MIIVLRIQTTRSYSFKKKQKKQQQQQPAFGNSVTRNQV